MSASAQIAAGAPVEPTGAEFDFIVACCADALDGGDRARTAISSSLDWDRVLVLSERHRVTRQVDESAGCPASRGIRDVGGNVEGEIRSRYRNNARKALWFAGELTRTVEHLDSRGVEALPYKGPVLAAQLYGAVTAREFCDLDILIRSGDLRRARAALAELGYEVENPLTGRGEQAYIASGYEQSFRHAHSRSLLELQWRILPRFYAVDFDIDGFFRRAGTVNVCGRQVRTLCAQDLFLVLCVHAAKHAWSELSLLCDIARLAKGAPPDWNAMQREARRLGLERILAINLLLIERWFGAAPPGTLTKDDQARRMLDAIDDTLRSSAPCDTESLAYFRFAAKLRERWRDRAQFWFRLALTPGPGEWETVRLPRQLFPLYRGVRFLRLARRLTTYRQKCVSLATIAGAKPAKTISIS